MFYYRAMTEGVAPGSNRAHGTLGVKEVHIFPSPFCPLGKIESQTLPWCDGWPARLWVLMSMMSVTLVTLLMLLLK